MKRKQYNTPCLKVVVLETSDTICLGIGSDTTDPIMLSKRRGQLDEDWEDYDWE